MTREKNRRIDSRRTPLVVAVLAVAMIVALIGVDVVRGGIEPAAAQGNQNSFLVVRAAGRSGGERLDVRVQGSTVGSITLDGSSSLTDTPNWRNYFFTVPASAAAGDVVLRYTNDSGLNTDVRVDHIILHNQTFETEAPGVVTTGGWGNGASCGTGTFQTDYLACSGSITYQSSASSGSGNLVVHIAGETGDERVNLRIGGAFIAELRPPASNSSFRTNPNWAQRSFQVDSNVDVSQIALQFFNDFNSPGYDRNVRIDKIELHGVVYETEASNVNISGAFIGGQCRFGSFGTDSMECNGQVTYTGGNAASAGNGNGSNSGGTTNNTGNAQQLAVDTKNRLQRTMNLGNALEAPNFEGEWDLVIEDWMFPTIKQAGFTAVRIPIRWSAHAQNNAPYTIDASWFARVDHVVNQAIANDLAVVINMHHYNELNNDPFGHRDRFLAMWSQIAQRYQGLPQSVSFELLNEPNGNIEPHWNSFAAQALSTVRQSNPNRTVLIGPTGFNKFERLQDLVLPNDNNLVVSVHYYEPFTVTHQKANFVRFDNGNLIFPNNQSCCDQNVEQQIRADMATIAQYATANNRPVFIGEFGVIRNGDNATRVDWTAHVRWRSQEQGFAWGYWEFGVDFGVFDRGTCQWNQSLHNALIPFPSAPLDANGVGCS